MARKSPPKVPGSSEPKEASAPTEPMAPAVAAATEAAEKMAYAEAAKLDGEGGLNRRVLTEKGWYIPRAAAQVA